MAAVSRLQSLTNKTSLHNLIHRHLLRPSAAATATAAHPFNISPESPTKLCSTPVHFSNANEFLLNWNLPIGGVSALPTFDPSMMELRGSRSTSKKRVDLEEDVEDDDEDDFDDDDDDDEDIDDAYGSYDDDDDDDDDYGRRGRGGGRGGGSRGGGAYTV